LTALTEQGESHEPLPAPRTLAAGLNRLGFRLRKVVKAQPQKPLPETDAIFDQRKKKPGKRRHRAPSNAGVSMAKRP
jgi:hypothetical protein